MKTLIVILVILFALCHVTMMAQPQEIVITMEHTWPGSPKRNIYVGRDSNGVRFNAGWVLGYPPTAEPTSIRLVYPTKTEVVNHFQHFIIVGKNYPEWAVRDPETCSPNTRRDDETFIGRETLVGLQTFHYRFTLPNSNTTVDRWHAPAMDCYPIRELMNEPGRDAYGHTPISVAHTGASKFTTRPSDYEEVTMAEGNRRTLVKIYGSVEAAPEALRRSQNMLEDLEARRKARGLPTITQPRELVVTMEETIPDPAKRKSYVGRDVKGVRFRTAYNPGYGASTDFTNTTLIYPDYKTEFVDHLLKFIVVDYPKSDGREGAGFEGLLDRDPDKSCVLIRKDDATYIGPEPLVGLETFHYRFTQPNRKNVTVDAWYAKGMDCYPIQKKFMESGRDRGGYMPTSVEYTGASRFTTRPNYEEVTWAEGNRRMLVKVYGSVSAAPELVQEGQQRIEEREKRKAKER